MDAQRTQFLEAIVFATESHADQTYGKTEPYILHPLRVMLRMKNDDERTVAMLHDVVEDTDVTIQELLDWGFQKRIVNAVNAITKKEGDDYFDYLTRVKINPLALAVKKADMLENTSNLADLRPKFKMKLIRKYSKAAMILVDEADAESVEWLGQIKHNVGKVLPHDD